MDIVQHVIFYQLYVFVLFILICLIDNGKGD